MIEIKVSALYRNASNYMSSGILRVEKDRYQGTELAIVKFIFIKEKVVVKQNLIEGSALTAIFTTSLENVAKMDKKLFCPSPNHRVSAKTKVTVDFDKIDDIKEAQNGIMVYFK